MHGLIVRNGSHQTCIRIDCQDPGVQPRHKCSVDEGSSSWEGVYIIFVGYHNELRLATILSAINRC